MNTQRTLIVGIGSPHGDDQVGWRVADRLAAWGQQGHIEVRRAASPSDLLGWLDDVERLMVCDACRGLRHVGEVRRWSWPTSEIPAMAWSGTHDLSLPAVLTLAQRLGRLPESVVVWAVEGSAEIAKETLTESLSAGVSAAIPELVTRIIGELNDVAPLVGQRNVVP